MSKIFVVFSPVALAVAAGVLVHALPSWPTLVSVFAFAAAAGFAVIGWDCATCIERKEQAERESRTEPLSDLPAPEVPEAMLRRPVRSPEVIVNLNGPEITEPEPEPQIPAHLLDRQRYLDHTKQLPDPGDGFTTAPPDPDAFVHPTGWKSEEVVVTPPIIPTPTASVFENEPELDWEDLLEAEGDG